ncbi:MAG: shikimate dehydrogenase [Lachnospiraceae bacterium]
MISMINGKTELMGVIGNPVTHTMSPTIHNTLAACMGKNMVYVPFPVKEDISNAIAGAFALGVVGMNVTVPYKSAVIPHLKSIDSKAEQIGAVNTLVRTENGYKGYNTDMPGLYRALLSEGIEISGNRIIIIGAGGAARAAAFLCAWKQAKEVYLLNRTPQKAVRIRDEIIEKTGFTNVIPLALCEYDKIPGEGYLVLQATKAGLYPHVEETPISEPNFFQKAGVVYDLIYTPQETTFMRLAREQGAKAYHGLKMLLYQGVLAYELWNNVTVPEDVIASVYEVLKKECGIHE